MDIAISAEAYEKKLKDAIFNFFHYEAGLHFPIMERVKTLKSAVEAIAIRLGISELRLDAFNYPHNAEALKIEGEQEGLRIALCLLVGEPIADELQGLAYAWAAQTIRDIERTFKGLDN